MKLRAGFSLLELLVAVMVASLLTSMLFFAYTQLQKGMMRFDIFIARHAAVELVERVMSRDLMGSCVPLTVLEQQQKEKQKKDAESQESDAQKKQTIESVFVAKVNNELTTSLTFISNNNLSSYVIEGITDPKPWLSRVTYKLEKETKGTYRLLRQQSHDLAIDSKQPWFPLAEQISSFSLVLVRYEKDDQGVYTAVERSEWDSNNPEKDDNGFVYLPDLIIVRLSFAKKMIGSGRSYSFAIPLFARPALLTKQQKQLDAAEEQKKKPNQTLPSDQKKESQERGAPQQQQPANSMQPGLPERSEKTAETARVDIMRLFIHDGSQQQPSTRRSDAVA